MDVALALDIGGTKLAAALVTADGELLRSATASTPTSSDAEVVFDALLALVDAVREPVPGPSGASARSGGPSGPSERGGSPVVVCGVGCGGPMTVGGEAVSPLNIGAWRGFPLRARLGASTGLPTFVDNDAKALALGEGWKGAAAGARDFIAMVVSTGVGGGIVLDGRLLDGANGNAGHVGHVIVEPDGRPCVCGGRGCLEAEASGPSIAAATGRPATDAGPEVVARTGRLVGQAVASVANLLDLSLAVVAGSVALGFGPPFFAAAQSELDARAPGSTSRAGRTHRARRPRARRPPRRRGRGRLAGPGPTVSEHDRSWLAAAAGAVLARPDLWGVAVAQLVRLARPGWWRRSPFLPVPDPAYLRFRLQTLYGDPDRDPEPADVVAYLHWCRGFRRVLR